MLGINTFQNYFIYWTSVLIGKCIRDSLPTMFDETSPSLKKVKTLPEDDCETEFSSTDSKICHFKLPDIPGFAASLLLWAETQERKEWWGQVDHQSS